MNSKSRKSSPLKNNKRHSNKLSNMVKVPYDEPESKFNNMSFSKIDKKSSILIRKLVPELLKLRDSIHIGIKENIISFSANTQNVHISLEIIKKVGFVLILSPNDDLKVHNYTSNCSQDRSQQFRKSYLLDKNLYKETLKKSIKIFKNLSRENVQNSYSEIIKELKISRDMNLKELFG